MELKRFHVFIAYTESQFFVKNFANKFIQRNNRITTDKSYAYGILLDDYDLRTVNYKDEYCSDFGVTNNQAESFFSRFKHMDYGNVHKINNTYLLNYSNEIAY